MGAQATDWGALEPTCTPLMTLLVEVIYEDVVAEVIKSSFTDFIDEATDISTCKTLNNYCKITV